MGKKRIEDAIQHVCDKAVLEGEIPGCNLLVRYGGESLIYVESGYADIEHKLPVKRDSIFRIYSMTNPVTATAVMRLMEEGQIDLVEPVSKYIPEFANQRALVNGTLCIPEREMTIQNLLSMTSGLVYGDDNSEAGHQTAEIFTELESRLFGENPMTTMELAQRLGKCVLDFAPGEKWKYGTSADVLGAVVESVTGMRFGDYLKEALFDPLEMKDTGFYVPQEKRDRLVEVYTKTEKNTMQLYKGNYLGILHDVDRRPAFESGGAGLCSTIDDYSHLADMLLNCGEYKGKKVLSPATVRFMTKGKLNQRQIATFGWGDAYNGHNYGNLLRILEDDRRLSMLGTIGEYGWDGWLGTYFCNIPKSDISILFMTQCTDSGFLPVVRKIRNIILSQKAECMEVEQ